MKRAFLLFFFVYVSLLGIFSAANAAAQASPPAIHEVWGIPWDIPAEEFIETAYQNTGIVFEPVKNDDRSPNNLIAINTSEISILGLPIESIRVGFTDFSPYYAFLLAYFPDPPDFITFDQIASMFSGTTQSLIDQYGSPDKIIVTIDGIRFFLPSADGFPDMDMFVEVCSTKKHAHFDVYFGNIILGWTIFSVPDWPMYSDYHGKFGYFLSLAAENAENTSTLNHSGIMPYSEYLELYPYTITTLPPVVISTLPPSTAPISLGF